ncbi:MAG: aspartate/glutamate racemase family protein [Candidatus Thorarchaeota archaeon]|nr:aspartate/glutamate racemase family protein [Candidatus Thorarchaeota archaeon]
MAKLALIGATGIDWWRDPKKKSFVELHTPLGSEIGNFTPRHGTHSVESITDEAYNAPFILEQVVKANKEGYDVIVIDCACDPVLEAAREVSKVPVVGPRNTALHFALTLGTRFGVVTVQGQSLKRCIEHGIRKEGLESFNAGVRFLKMPVLDIGKKPEQAQKEILHESRELIQNNGADVIVLGCTALSHEVNLKPIMDELKVPIIDPWIIAIKTAFMLVESGLSHSKVAYPFPPKKKINEAPSLVGAFDDILKE